MANPNTPCVRTLFSLGKGKLSQQQAAKVVGDIWDYARALTPKFGGNFDSALVHVINKEIQRIQRKRAHRQLQRVLDQVAVRRMEKFVDRFPKYASGFRAFLTGTGDKVKGARLSVDYQAKSQGYTSLGRTLVALEDQGVIKEFLSNKNPLNWAKELWELTKQSGTPGITNDPAAKKIAEVFFKIFKENYSLLNRAGTDIEPMEGYVVPQTHDRSRIVADNPNDMEAAFKTWRAIIEPLLDPVETFKGKDPEKFLRSVHANLYTGDFDSANIEAKIYSDKGLGSKHSSSRLLMFKGAEDWYKYSQIYATKDLRSALLNHIMSTSKTLALIENLGPSFEANFEKAKAQAVEKAKLRPDADKQMRSLQGPKLQGAFDIVTGKLDVPKSQVAMTVAKFQQNLNVVLSTSSLGEAIFSSFTDPIMSHMAATANGLSTVKLLKNWMSVLGQQDKRALKMMGYFSEGFAGHTAIRFSQQDLPSGMLGRFQEAFFKVSLLAPWTDNLKKSYGHTLASELGEHADKPWNQLPAHVKDTLELYNFEQREWELWRGVVSDGFLTSDLVRNFSRNDALALASIYNTGSTLLAKHKLENKIATMFIDQTDMAVPTPGASERNLATFMGKQAGTPAGVFARAVSLFRLYPLTISNKIMAREVYGRGNKSFSDWMMNDHKGKLRLLSYTAGATAMAMVGMWAKDLLHGREPREVDAKFLREALQKSGTIGLLGDLLFADYSRGSRDFSSVIAGPAMSKLIDPVMESYTQLKSGEPDKAGKTAVKAIAKSIPGANLIFFRQAIDYLILWHLQEMLDPGTLRKMERDLKERTGQEYIKGHPAAPEERLKW